MLIKIIKTHVALGAVIIFGGLLVQPHQAGASNNLDTTTPALTAPQTVTISPDLAQAWQGLYQLPAFSLVYQPQISLPNLVNNYFGKPSQRSNPTYHTYYYNPGAIYQWLNQTLATTLDLSAQEPQLEIQNGRATNFVPPQTGHVLNLYQSTLNVIQALESGNTSASLVMDSTQPKTVLADLNDLGINELIGRGESNYGNSPANRRHNIAVGVSKMTGVIIAPGDEFSFNKYLGPVEADQGFLPELVIKGDKGTIPELGGGLCQVSSTTFRAAMQAGLPITERRNHSYAVSYYAPQGTDATIYPGAVDLKFINDTPGSILIWPYFGPKNTLFFDFYGTNDHRQVTLENPIQFDRKPDGSLKASWTRTIVKDGVSTTHTFNSDYLPPALFHKQEQFVANPTSGATTPAGSTPAPGTPGAITPVPPQTPPPATSTTPSPSI